VNFPLALIALPILGLLFERLPGAEPAALAGAVLCAAVFWPGVVDQGDLDAKPVNALAAVGVGVAVALTALAARGGICRLPVRPAAVAAAFGLVVLASPWIAADLGFYLAGVPGLGDLFQTQTRIDGVPAVHHGHHHGLDGLLLVAGAGLLSRSLADVRRRGLRHALTGYLALMASYGAANIANDFWLEQVVKRGWTSWQIPNVLQPRLSVAWAVIVAAAALLWAAGALRRAGERSSQRPS
jgi:hypothetical protein